MKEDMKVVHPSESEAIAFNLKANQAVQKVLVAQHEHDLAYIGELEKVIQENHIEMPEVGHDNHPIRERANTERIMLDGSLASLAKATKRTQDHVHKFSIHVQYRNLTFWNNLPKKTIETVGSAMMGLLGFGGKKERVDIIKDLTGKILPQRMTLVMGPPGCGKTTFLKALSGQLTIGSAHLEGDILYNGDSIKSGKFLIGKVASYSDEKEQHAPTLTVKETLEFAWKMTTGGHHSYSVAKDEESAEILNKSDEHQVLVNNTLKILGLHEVSDTLVGDGTIRGVSGGQKRRVTLGEMLVPPRGPRFLDAISNGLDAATTYDIVQALKYMTDTMEMTTVISLLQPAPDVFYSFTDVIVMAEGQIIYHGATTKVLEYFTNLGYHCPDIMDVADFLQELPTPDGRRFTVGNKTIDGKAVPIGTEALVQVWKESTIFKAMLAEMDIEESEKGAAWPAVYAEAYPGSFWFMFKLLLDREYKLLIRNTAFLKGRVISNAVVAGIASSLFNNLPVESSNSMSGIIFFAALFGAMSSFSTMPLIFEARAVFYKHSKSLFYPTSAYVMAQTIVMYPLMIIETIVFTTIIYWTVGLSDDLDGSRYFTFMFAIFTFGLCMTQFFRLIASVLSSPTAAQSLGGIFIILQILFCGFIVPKSNIPPGWEWFYYINPIAYVLNGVTINEFLSPDYDFLVCVDAACTEKLPFGIVTLESRGNDTEQHWVWYCVAIMIGMYVFYLFLTTLGFAYVRVEPTPPPPIVLDLSDEEVVEGGTNKAESNVVEIPFEPVTFAFKDICYTVKLANGEELDLLKGVAGFFEPGTLTALMGSSGAGKTTLLDVLSGRKNTGTVTGEIYINGKPLEKAMFRRTMGYVEQFDTLSPTDTAREAIEFSAALRLASDTPADIRKAWVNSVLTLLELMPLENTMIGSAMDGGMSFEQKKRVSIGVELVANPAILFLDEPTSGLDSRSAQVVMRCIKRVAASGRSIVCTIHQPSAVIFDAFDSLLLLRRGGQTVFFGELGEKFSSLVSYFESIPDVTPKEVGVNPATWMLEVIGAGTSNMSNTAGMDFHAQYKKTTLCEVNSVKIAELCRDQLSNKSGDNQAVSTSTIENDLELGAPAVNTSAKLNEPDNEVHHYNASYWVQFQYLMRRYHLAYWRSPAYNFGRMFTAVVVALIFSSTYANQKFSSDVDIISRVALIYITVLFMGVIGMNGVQPVVFAERPAFYREQYSKIYDVKLYTLAATIVEIPYIIISAVLFVIPYFWIVGFDKGDTVVKFFWYWGIMAQYMGLCVYIGHFLASALPNEASSAVLGGVVTTCISLFCGFMIQPGDFPDFWIFMYWLSPLHYAIEALIGTQFYGDKSIVEITGSTDTMTAEDFTASFYSDWRYKTRWYDVMAMFIFIFVLRIGAYLCFEYVRHDKR